MRRHGFLAAALLGTAATTVWLLNLKSDLGASEESARSFRETTTRGTAYENAQEDPNGVRLNFFDTTWERVLRNVADQQNLTLVMDQIPPGRFAWRERRTYELGSAIRILNSHLERQGYRLLLQNEFLIVLNLDKARTEYARPQLSDPSAARLISQPDDGGMQRQNASIEERLASSNERFPLQRTTIPNAAASDDQSSGRGSSLQQRSDSVTGNRPPFGTPIRAASFGRDYEDEPAQETADERKLTQSFECQHTKAADLARTLYLVFEKRAELQRDGVQGYPSFAVFAPANSPAEAAAAKQSAPVFRVGIDQERNQLLIEASSERITHLQALATELDKPANPAAPGEAVKLVPNNGIAAKTAQELNQQLHQLVSMQDDAGTPAQNNPFNAGNVEQPANGGEGDSLNLRGDVNIQAMTDLSILILKGNQADVDKVAEIIARLEQMSIGSVPDIHILTLKNVNSEAMADLLTSVYERLSELRRRGNTNRETTAIIPVVQPNAILILAPKIELDAILQLADELDKPLEPDFEFKVFPLKNAIASQVVTSLETFYNEPTGLRARPRVVADVRTNSVIVQGRANDLNEVAKLIERIDKDESGAVHRVQIFPLKNAVAEELQATISSAIQSVINPPQQSTQGGFGGFGGFGGTQGAQELRDSKSVALEFLASDGATRELVRSGILADVRINADARTNSLIVSSPEASMSLLAALIRELDQSPSAIAEIKVFTLKNADAEQSVTLLESVFENQNQQDQLGIQIAGTEDAASSLIPARFSADIRTNSVLAVGSAEALSVVEAVLLRLDTADVRQRTTEVLPLRNAPAEVVAAALLSFLEQQASLQDSSADLVSNIERLRQEVLVAEDTNSNSLIISASPQYFTQITKIVETLDATPPEVVIQGLIVEVTLDATDEFGIELGFQDPLLLSRSLSAITTPAPGMNFNNTLVALGNGTTNSNAVGTQGLSNFSLGRQNADLGFGGFVFSAQSDAVSVLLRALASRRTVQILSRPQIRTTHNSLGIVSVGQSVPVVNGVNITTLGTANPTVVRENTGISLEVTPRITPDGIIAMSVYANKSSLAANGVPIYVDGNSGNSIESPIINQSIADTTVNVPNGQTIVIGGMITKSDSTLERKVPWLGDLPIVGKAFRYDGTTTSRTELLIFLTPRIILNDLDSELIKQVESERLHFIESEAEELHGPLYSIPSVNQNFEDPYRDFDPQFYSPSADPGIERQVDHLVPAEPVLPGQARRDGSSDQKSKPGADEGTSWGEMEIQPVSARGNRESLRSAKRAVSQSGS
ncbi:MAG: hypothetical protein KDA91_07770 [Planctomycetaceae bacterium]|nr:hypothetical protein [Planctomycetaceae bacterium]